MGRDNTTTNKVIIHKTKTRRFPGSLIVSDKVQAQMQKAKGYVEVPHNDEQLLELHAELVAFCKKIRPDVKFVRKFVGYDDEVYHEPIYHYRFKQNTVIWHYFCRQKGDKAEQIIEELEQQGFAAKEIAKFYMDCGYSFDAFRKIWDFETGLRRSQ
jgi:nicotinamidase-related amidase